MMVEMSQLSGASMTPCGWVGPVVGGEDLNSISQHTLSCGHFSGEMLLYWYKLCCDRFNTLGENPSEEMMCSNPI